MKGFCCTSTHLDMLPHTHTAHIPFQTHSNIDTAVLRSGVNNKTVDWSCCW